MTYVVFLILVYLARMARILDYLQECLFYFNTAVTAPLLKVRSVFQGIDH